MAHGWAVLNVDRKGNHLFELLMYKGEANKQFQLYRATSTRERLLEAAENVTRHAEDAIRLFRRIYREKGLEK